MRRDLIRHNITACNIIFSANNTSPEQSGLFSCCHTVITRRLAAVLRPGCTDTRRHRFRASCGLYRETRTICDSSGTGKQNRTPRIFRVQDAQRTEHDTLTTIYQDVKTPPERPRNGRKAIAHRLTVPPQHVQEGPGAGSADKPQM